MQPSEFDLGSLMQGTAPLTERQAFLMDDHGLKALLSECASFDLYVIDPLFPTLNPPKRIEPEVIPGSSEMEPVYPITDYGFRLSTSKAEDMYEAGFSMCKLHYTIEKMIALLIDRLKASGVSPETEVKVAFGGHLSAQRKCFEVIINLQENVTVTNFEPGPWGERFLETMKKFADKGYGYPQQAPRHTYHEVHHPHSKK